MTESYDKGDMLGVAGRGMSLAWAMGHERLPRKFLTSWVRNPRPHGRPRLTFGHSLNKTLEQAGIETDFGGKKNAKGWSDLAQDRGAWRTLIHSTAVHT